MNDAPRTNEDRLYDLGERYGKGVVKFRCDQNKAYYMNKRPFYKGYIEGRKQQQEVEKGMTNCKHCGSSNIYMRPNAKFEKHTEIICHDCGKWNKFVGADERHTMKVRGIKYIKGDNNGI